MPSAIKASLKRQVAGAALLWQLPALLAHPNRLNELLGQAVRLQYGMITEEQFRLRLDGFYAGLDRGPLMEQIDFAGKAERLDPPGGYKSRITRLREDAADARGKAPGFFWHRRFALLHHLGVRLDVLILRAGEQIPPHGHYRVVSGFYVLDGEVAVRHYDRVREEGARLLVRQTLDAVLGPGGYTTNSEYHQNIHWLCGLGPRSYLFRVTVSGTPTKTFGGGRRRGERVYVDPTGAPGPGGLIAAPYVSEAEACRLRFAPAPVNP
jgi:hypothetical protein